MDNYENFISHYTLDNQPIDNQHNHKLDEIIENFSSSEQSKYIGCFRDTPNLDLPKRVGNKTYKQCETNAKKRGYKYFGLQYQNGIGRGNRDLALCLLGNTYGKHGGHSNCKRLSNGKMYGQSWSNTIYEVPKKYNYNLVNGNHNEKSRSYSSIWSNNRIGTGHARSTINSPQAWSLHINDRNYNRGRWMVIDMGSIKKIGGVIIQSRGDGASYQYVTRLDIYISDEKNGPWTMVLKDSKGISKPMETKEIHFNGIKSARYVKFVVKKWSNYPSLRADVLVYTKNNDELHRKSERQNVIKKAELVQKVDEVNYKSVKEGNDLVKKFANMGENLKKMREDSGNFQREYDDYLRKSKKWKADNIDKQMNMLNRDKSYKNKYFDTLYNFHKDLSRDKVIDAKSLKVRKNILERREDEIEDNTNNIIYMDNDIETNMRQRNISLQSEKKRENNQRFMFLLTTILILIIICVVLKKRNIINSEMISYIIFSAIILLGGFVLMKFENNKLRSSYNYFEKIFKSKTIEDEEEDN
tara:strand:+ start:3640 stop:5220 length:1581 start_codon:yes stop_codon:yes gene_type:complete